MKRTLHLTLLAATIAAAALLTSCRSQKTPAIPTDPTAVAQADPVTRINFNRITSPTIRAKVNLNVERGNSRLSVGGTLKMIRNEIIQLSLTPYGLVEVGRLELTPDYILLVDRWGKQYVQAKWRDIDDLHRAGIDFYTFQALFWEELVVPGKKDRATRQDFDIEDQGATLRLQPTRKAADPETIGLAFVARNINGLIEQTTITTPTRSDLKFRWRYANWTGFEGKDFPAQMLANIDAAANHFAATINLTHLQSDSRLKNLRTVVDTNRYRKVEIETIINRLMTM